MAQANAVHTTSEDINDKVTRLAWELAEALNDYCGAKYHAVIHPSAKEHHAVLFAVTEAYKAQAELCTMGGHK